MSRSGAVRAGITVVGILMFFASAGHIYSVDGSWRGLLSVLGIVTAVCLFFLLVPADDNEPERGDKIDDAASEAGNGVA